MVPDAVAQLVVFLRACYPTWRPEENTVSAWSLMLGPGGAPVPFAADAVLDVLSFLANGVVGLLVAVASLDSGLPGVPTWAEVREAIASAGGALVVEHVGNVGDTVSP